MENKKNSPSYRVIAKGGVGEITEKKSRFIATVSPVDSEEEAQEFISQVKKQHWDARHNCSAFIVGERGEITRCSDDGEPSGTSGRPMLEVLLSQGLHNVAAVVTRYFGGVLLGTGGLVRAYTRALQEGLAASEIATLSFGTAVELETDYGLVGKVQYILGKEGITIDETRYTDKVVFCTFLLEDEKERVLKEITEATAGKCAIVVKDSFYAPVIRKE